MKAGIDRLARTAEKADRDPSTIEIGYLWFKPVSWTEARTKDGGRQMFTGTSAQMTEDVAALKRIGVRHLVVLLAEPVGDGDNGADAAICGRGSACGLTTSVPCRFTS